jgi:hypothetical protein
MANHIEAIPSINLPWLFANGSCIASLTFKCGGCGREVHSKHVKGIIESTGPSAPVAILRESYAICYSCHTISPHSEIRFDYEGGLLTKTAEGGWKKGSWGKMKPRGFVAKISALLTGKNIEDRRE